MTHLTKAIALGLAAISLTACGGRDSQVETFTFIDPLYAGPGTGAAVRTVPTGAVQTVPQVRVAPSAALAQQGLVSSAFGGQLPGVGPGQLSNNLGGSVPSDLLRPGVVLSQ